MCILFRGGVKDGDTFEFGGQTADQVQDLIGIKVFPAALFDENCQSNIVSYFV